MHAKVEHYAEIEAVAGDFAVTWRGREIARADLVMQLTEFYRGRSMAPVLYFRPADIDHEWLEENPATSVCPVKGMASYWDLVEGHHRARGAVWSYQRPLPMAEPIRGCFGFDPTQGVEIRAIDRSG